MLPVLRASNAAVFLADRDRPQGALLVGGQGSGKSSALLRLYLNDIRDENAAVILIDPKSEVSDLAFRLTPPDCGKQVWYLDLGRPAFGMTPLRMFGEQDFASEAAAIADGIVESLLDVNEGQIMQSSRDLLYRSVIGALAIAHHDRRPPTFEDVYSLLMPGREDAREAAFNACSRIYDLDQTAEFFRKELPDDLRMSSSSMSDRLRAPRNKVAGIVGVPPLRRFLNHHTDMPLSRIVENRDILIVSCNMAAVGEANAQAMMHFIFRLLHRQMQRQVHWPEEQRPRVALLADEFHYLASRNVIRQIATHRAAGLDVTASLQFFSQLGAGAESASVTEEIRKGAINLLQSRFLFRLGDPQDAEEATRIAMAVYQSMIRSDPDSRAQMRVMPESILNLPRWHCLASWIVDGTRAASFIGQTYAMPHDISTAWADDHLGRQAQRVGPYPEKMAGTLRRTLSSPETSAVDVDLFSGEVLADDTHQSASRDAHGSTAPSARAVDRRAAIDRDDLTDSAGADPTVDLPGGPAPQRPAPVPTRERRPSSPSAGATTAREEGKRGADIYVVEQAARPEASMVRTLVGNPPRGQTALFESAGESDGKLPAALRALAFLDRVNEIGQVLDVVDQPEPPGRLYAQDLTILKFLDRAGITLPTLIQRAALPGKSESQVRRKLGKLHKHGLVGRRKVGIRERTGADGQLPSAYELSRAGFELAKERHFIPDRREYRPSEITTGLRVPHDHHAVGWYVELNRLLGDIATDNWRTPRYATGRFAVPHVGAGHKRRPMGPSDIDIAAPQAVFDISADDFKEIKPDVCAELHIQSTRLRFDLLVEYHHHANIPTIGEKFRAYDAFLTGWCLEHNRVKKQTGTRPIVVFVAANPKDLLALAKKADEAMRGAVAVQGTGPHEWYYAGRDHIFFALEEDVYRGTLQALALPPLPAGLRARRGDEGLELSRVALLPPSMTAAAQRKAKRDA